MTSAKTRTERARRMRVLLFVPGDRPDRIAKAAAGGATAVAVDLEDSVALSRKDHVRQDTARTVAALPPDGALLTVRINSVASGLAEQDVRALTPVLGRLSALILPMCDSAADVRRVAALLDAAEAEAGLEPGCVGIVPLIESARGVLEAAFIAAGDARVITLTFGPADLSRELGVTPTATGTELLAARSTVVLAAAAAGLPHPIDGPFLDLEDDEGLRVSAERARAIGFGGKQIIHPRQLNPVAAAFVPTAEEIDWARRVDEAFTAAEERGVASIRLADGTFVDYPVASRARALLAAAGAGHE
ncbi:CoA ester lyase [Streptomyces sp. NPDC088124]|uniref:HpcH/HpaI aldolase/citrate lyase family protein n=1 Tax=Streptomyces sp. NPDC088124 TaxID=3154654 RepID=UPI003441DBE0